MALALFRQAEGDPKPIYRSVASGTRVEAIDVTQHVRSRQLLRETTLVLEPGELVGIAGGSGAGKTTLLKVLAGIDAASAGQVLHDGEVVDAKRQAADVGYVPQEDIIHGDLQLRRTLRHAARLRLPHDTAAEAIDSVVDATLEGLDLAERGDVRVRDLSGGQRKRASIAVELLTRPRLLVLDEPTSGLDPATGAEVLDVLRRFAGNGTTVVLTTHAPEDLVACDRVIFLARDGHLAFDGTPQETLDYFQVGAMPAVYRRLAREGTPTDWAKRFRARRGPRAEVLSPLEALADERPRQRGQLRRVLRQWMTVTTRDAELLLHNRLTLAIILGSPLLVTIMMATLFQAGTVDPERPLQSVNLAFWLAFDGFFFGLTYGLLQIVTEFPIFRREKRAGLGVGAYVAAKVTVLLPVLLAIDVLLLAVLRATDRLPAGGFEMYGPLAGIFLLDALAGLACGLLASSLVRHPAQAALALPMICFPQVLFGGAIVPVSAMAAPGEWLSTGMVTRWAFEAMVRVLEIGGGAPDGPSSMPDYGSAMRGSSLDGATVMAMIFVVLTAATVLALRQRARSG